MTTIEDAQKNGMVQNPDGTLTNSNTGQIYIPIECDTGQLIVKPLGAPANVYDRYDPTKH